jgi:hypothetical protein
MMAWVANPNQWIGVQLPNLAYELSRQVKLVLKQIGICSWGNILSYCVVLNFFWGILVMSQGNTKMSPHASFEDKLSVIS